MIKELTSFTRIFSSKMPYLDFFVTARCNSKCLHCFYWKKIENSNKKKELRLDEIQKISKNLGEIYYLTLTGGEPTLRDDIIEIIQLFYKQNDVKQLAFHSNGFNSERLCQITKEVLETCPNMIFIVALSIEDFEKNHDKIRSVNGGFKRLMRSIGMLKKFENFPNFELSLNTTLMHYNKENIIKLHQFITNELKLPYDINYTRGDARDLKTKENIFQTYKKIIKIIKEQKLERKHNSIFLRMKDHLMHLSRDIIIRIEENRNSIPPCKALKKSVVIDEEGAVFPCEMLNTSLGNLRDYGYNINRILNTKKSKKIKKWIKKTKCKCTWECILPVNIVFSLKGKVMLIKKLLKN